MIPWEKRQIEQRKGESKKKEEKNTWWFTQKSKWQGIGYRHLTVLLYHHQQRPAPLPEGKENRNCKEREKKNNWKSLQHKQNPRNKCYFFPPRLLLLLAASARLSIHPPCSFFFFFLMAPLLDSSCWCIVCRRPGGARRRSWYQDEEGTIWWMFVDI